MSTLLQQQLQQVAIRWGGSGRQPTTKGKPSLLYEPQEAADIDLQTLYSQALEGDLVSMALYPDGRPC